MNIEKRKRGDDYIRAVGGQQYVNTMLKGIIFVLVIALISISFFTISLLNKVAEVKPLPIFIDRLAGSARPVDFSAIDASGTKRDESEIHDYCKNYVSDIYTFNKFTVESNLKKVISLTANECVPMIKNVVIKSNRSENVQYGLIGICEINSITILETDISNIRVQVMFTEKVLDMMGNEKQKRDAIAVIFLKTVLRQKDNAHGLYVFEYRESDILRNNNEGDAK